MKSRKKKQYGWQKLTYVTNWTKKCKKSVTTENERLKREMSLGRKERIHLHTKNTQSNGDEHDDNYQSRGRQEVDDHKYRRHYSLSAMSRDPKRENSNRSRSPYTDAHRQHHADRPVKEKKTTDMRYTQAISPEHEGGKSNSSIKSSDTMIVSKEFLLETLVSLQDTIKKEVREEAMAREKALAALELPKIYIPNGNRTVVIRIRESWI